MREGLLLVVAACAVGCASPTAVEVPPGLLIAHALGGIDGVTYSNSHDAFQASYAAGYRWFEVDLSLSRDGDLVCFHDGFERELGLDRPLVEVATREFLARRYAGRFRLMTLVRLLALLDEHRDAVLVTDTKHWSEPVATAFIAAVRTAPEAVRRRLVLQFYHPDNLEHLQRIEREVGPLGPRIFTLYQVVIGLEPLVELVERERLAVVTIGEERFQPVVAERLHAAGARVLVHTVNDPARMRVLAEQGVDGFYTDWLRPAGGDRSG